MAVLVTGGAGFIGSNLVDELLVMGHEVTVLDNFSEGREKNLPRDPDNLNRYYPNLEVIRGDVRDFDLVRRAVDHKDWVFHLAAMSRIQPSIYDPLLAVDQNIVGTFNVLEACRQAGVKRLVFSSTCATSANGTSAPVAVRTRMFSTSARLRRCRSG